MAERYSSPPPRGIYHPPTSPPPVKSAMPPMLPAAELYLALRDEDTILKQNFDDPALLEDSKGLYISGGEVIEHFEPAVSACERCPTFVGVRHVFLAYKKHKKAVSIERCLDALRSSSMLPEQQQLLHRWIFEETGLPANWQRCDIYMSLRRGCHSLLEDFGGDGDDPRLLPVQLEVPCYGFVDFDPLVNAFACCPDVLIIKHLCEACLRRNLAVHAIECTEALQTSPLPRKQVVELLKWLSLRVDLPHRLQHEKGFPHGRLVCRVLEELPMIRAKAFFSSIVDQGCMENIMSFILYDSKMLAPSSDLPEFMPAYPPGMMSTLRLDLPWMISRQEFAA